MRMDAAFARLGVRAFGGKTSEFMPWGSAPESQLPMDGDALISVVSRMKFNRRKGKHVA